MTEQKKDQSQKFVDAAREAEADVDEETLRRTLGKLAKAKPVDKEANSSDKERKSR